MITIGSEAAGWLHEHAGEGFDPGTWVTDQSGSMGNSSALCFHNPGAAWPVRRLG
jgi:hypothetical protein